MRYITLGVLILAACGTASSFACDEISSGSSSYSESSMNSSVSMPAAEEQYNYSTSSDSGYYRQPQQYSRRYDWQNNRDYNRSDYRDYNRRDYRDYNRSDYRDNYRQGYGSDRSSQGTGVHIGGGDSGHGAGINIGSHGLGIGTH